MARDIIDLVVRWTRLACVDGEDWQWLPFVESQEPGIEVARVFWASEADPTVGLRAAPTDEDWNGDKETLCGVIKMNPVFWAVALVVVLVGLFISWQSRSKNLPKTQAGEEDIPEGGRIPAAQLDAEEGLEFSLIRQSNDSSESLVLKTDEGGVSITLEFSPGFREAAEFVYGRGSVAASSRASGVVMAERFSEWLETPLPDQPGYTSDLEPVPCSAAWLGSEFGAEGVRWDVVKLFFEHSGEYAELLMRLDSEGDRAVFLEKDWDHRDPLIEVLTVALRDGPPPRRSMETDSNLASEDALARELAPLEGAPQAAHVATWGSSGLIVADSSSTESRILLWKSLPMKPRLLASVEGVVQEVVGSPNGELVAITRIHSSDGRTVSSDDEVELLLLNTEGKARSLAGKGGRPSIHFNAHPVWSPDSSMLAFSIGVPKKPRGTHSQSIVVSAADGKEIFKTNPELNVTPKAWGAGGLLLEATDFDGDYNRTYRRYVWWLGDTAPSAVASEEDARSPGGKFRIRFSQERVAAESESSRLEFVPVWASDKKAVETLGEFEPRWIGDWGLVVDSDELIVLDLSTGKSYLLLGDQGSFTFLVSSPDGKTIVVIEDGELRWGNVSR